VAFMVYSFRGELAGGRAGASRGAISLMILMQVLRLES
jgi:hypothetical protein